MSLRRLSVLAVLAASLTASAPAAASIVPVRADGDGGWQFNRDPATSTPYAFTTAAPSIGFGSLFVPPIANLTDDDPPLSQPADKFVAEQALGVPTAALASIAYDFKVAALGLTQTPYKDFYLNVYTNLPASTTFYDCRFDFVPASAAGSGFTTFTAMSTTTRTAIGDRAGDGFTCPTTWAGMPAGSTVSFYAINVGGSSLSDTGLSGYLDNVVVTDSLNAATTSDFEPTPDWNLGTFAAPVDEEDLNLAKAGQAVPVKVQVTDPDGNPVTTDPGLTLTSTESDCTSATGTTDVIETYAGAASGWQHQGDGVWQLNWKTPKAYAGTCREMKVDVPASFTLERTATFRFR